eukprot:GFUD01029885.1.p1 GENE.GFUD01029885.1~~GFUD01029885.1.p1  ORF type:complete len:418 (-),score=106.40 GFUD01029885.1:57-1286(-)
MSLSKAKAAAEFNWCFTSQEPNTTKVFNWTVDNFMSRIGESSSEYLTSDVFKVKEENFRLKLNHKEKKDGGKFVGLFLEYGSANPPPTPQLILMPNYKEQNRTVKVSCQFELSSNSKPIVCNRFEGLNLDLKSKPHGYPTLVTHDKLEKAIENDTLKISATITLHGEDKQKSSKYSIENLLEGCDAEKEVGENLWLAFKDKQFCDFTLISKDRKSFPCHKVVLASRSPVLQKMLNSGMKESKNQKLEVKHYDSELLVVLLEFMYKGVIHEETLKSSAEKIFKAAHFYEMATLKQITEMALIEQMDTENMLQRFLMADMHDAKELRQASKNLIIENSEALVKNKDWKKTITTSHDEQLVYEILEGMALGVGGVINKSVKRKHEQDEDDNNDNKHHFDYEQYEHDYDYDTD